MALLPIVASAYDAEVDSIYYDLTEDGAIVTFRDYEFNSYSGTVTIPSSITYDGVTSINRYAFAYCYGLTDVYCLAEDVPTAKEETFEESPIRSATLHVPAASLEQYQTTAPWRGFGKIVALTDEDIANAIEEVKASKATTEIVRYDIHGRKLSTPQNQRSTYVKGINIIRYSDGTSKKVLLK